MLPIAWPPSLGFAAPETRNTWISAWWTPMTTTKTALNNLQQGISNAVFLVVRDVHQLRQTPELEGTWSGGPWIGTHRNWNGRQGEKVGSRRGERLWRGKRHWIPDNGGYPMPWIDFQIWYCRVFFIVINEEEILVFDYKNMTIKWRDCNIIVFLTINEEEILASCTSMLWFTPIWS